MSRGNTDLNNKPAISYDVIKQYDIKELPTEETVIDYGAREPLVQGVDLEKQEVALNTEGLPIEIEIDNIGALPNEQYALLRRNGFGASDSSILCGVNPYKTLGALIAEKSTPHLSEEEKRVGLQVAVRKGNDLEPMIIDKFSRYFGRHTIKPVDMYYFPEYPWLKINYDGVCFFPDGKPYPVEIKVITIKGLKHYNFDKAIFNEGIGWQAIPTDVSGNNISIASKADHYGIPPYYYTQVQQEMMGCDAPYGLLTALSDKDWTIHTFFIWKDTHVQNMIKVNSYKAWEMVLAARAQKGYTQEDFTPDLSAVENPPSKTSMFDNLLAEL